MKNQIIPLGEDKRKVFGFSDEQIIVSTKGHSSFDALLAATNKSGILETVSTIPTKSMKEIVYNENEDTFTIRYNKDGKTKKDTFLLANVSSREAVVSEIASLKQLNKTVAAESKTKPLLLNLFWVLVIPAATWIFRGMAIDAQTGGHYEASGRRSGLGQLLANAVEAIGPLGVTIIGVLALLYMLKSTYDRYNNPASEVKYV